MGELCSGSLVGFIFPLKSRNKNLIYKNSKKEAHNLNEENCAACSKKLNQNRETFSCHECSYAVCSLCSEKNEETTAPKYEVIKY